MHHQICKEIGSIKEISFDCVYKGNINEIVKGKKKSKNKLNISLFFIYFLMKEVESE